MRIYVVGDVRGTSEFFSLPFIQIALLLAFGEAMR